MAGEHTIILKPYPIRLKCPACKKIGGELSNDMYKFAEYGASKMQKSPFYGTA